MIRPLQALAILFVVFAFSACQPLSDATAPAGEDQPPATTDETAPAATSETSGEPAATTGSTAPDMAAPIRIQFPAGGTSASEAGQLPAGGAASYVLGAQGGQFLNAALAVSQGDATLSLSGADGTVLLAEAAGAQGWSGALPTKQDYTVVVQAGGEPAAYTLTVTIPAVPTTAPDTSATPEAQRIQFAPGGTSATVDGSLAPSGLARYVLGIQAGQTLEAVVTATAGAAALSVNGADGTVLISPMGGLDRWSGTVPSTQDYYIDVRADPSAGATYVLAVSIP